MLNKRLVVVTAAVCASAGFAEVELDTSAERVDTPLKLNLKRVGSLRPRSTMEIKSSNFMLGCECSDRDLVDFDGYKKFLPALGLKTIRVQGGWQKCEKVQGVYDFAWLDNIVDFYNPKRKAVEGVFNTKGLLRTDLDKKVVGIKRAYYAVQNLASVFDDRWTRVKDSTFSSTDAGIATYEYVKDTGEKLYLFWRFTSTVPQPIESGDSLHGDDLKPQPVRPGDSFETAPAVFLVKDGTFLKDPVWVDVFSGKVFEFPKREVAPSRDATRYMNVPVYDSPCFLTERSALDLTPAGEVVGFKAPTSGWLKDCSIGGS
ncbi:MAG TPA: hypothetical protein PKI32_00545 [Opitutales bacterium]|nr:hypothetical protein [Opitutales bacterium]